MVIHMYVLFLAEWTMGYLFVTHDPVTQRSRLIKKCKGNYFRVNSVQSKSFFCPPLIHEKRWKTADRKKTNGNALHIYTYIHTS